MLKWSRPEAVGVFLLEGGARIYHFDCADGSRAIAIAADDQNETAVRAFRSVVRQKFRGVRILNGASPLRAYDEELLTALSQNEGITFSTDITAWDRAIVKMGLGLACLVLGDAFVESSAAARLRLFLREPDSARRDQINLRGHAGIARSRPAATRVIHPGGYKHLFLLSDQGNGLGFSANLFGRFENNLLLADTDKFGALLPGEHYFMRGTGWVVDPTMKTVRGPIPLMQLVADSVQSARGRA